MAAGFDFGARFRPTVGVADVAAHPKRDRIFLQSAHQSVAAMLDGMWLGRVSATPCYRLSRRGGFASISFHSGR